jgi:hypothetical protein
MMAMNPDDGIASQSNVRNDFDWMEGKALSYWQRQIDFYERVHYQSRWSHQISLILTILLSGITPVLVLLDEVPNVVQALPPAIVTILVGMSGAFQWRENWVRYSQTLEKLKVEKLKYDTQSSEYGRPRLSERTRLSRFVTKMAEITLSETAEWRELMRKVGESAMAEEEALEEGDFVD